MENMQNLLYAASVEGNTSVLQTLLQKDPLILDKVTLTRYDDMPLHVASMLGHTAFVNEIVTRRPKLAAECDSQRRLPIHIAAAKGHVDIVKMLVLVNRESCSARDRDGMNPVHVAAVRGRVEVVKELVRAQSHVARAMVQQESVLHLCVRYNQLEVLKVLVERLGDYEFVNAKDADGNTVLHLAVADKQIETVNFLLMNTTIEANASNTNGETSLDILSQGPKDKKDQQILRALTRAGVADVRNESFFTQIPRKPINETKVDHTMKHYKKSKLQKDSNDNGDWLDKKRNTLMVVASLIATMAFQAGTNPPSGVWQESSTTNPPHQAGYAVMPSNHPTFYNVFLVCNTVGFVSTLSIILLLISGLPFLRHKVFLWVLMVIMWIATSSMTATYWISISVLTPKPEAQTFKNVVNGIVLAWISLMTLLVAGHAIRVMEWFHKAPVSKKNAILSPTVIHHAGI